MTFHSSSLGPAHAILQIISRQTKIIKKTTNNKKQTKKQYKKQQTNSIEKFNKKKVYSHKKVTLVKTRHRTQRRSSSQYNIVKGDVGERERERERERRERERREKRERREEREREREMRERDATNLGGITSSITVQQWLENSTYKQDYAAFCKENKNSLSKPTC